MGILGRINSVIKSNLNQILDKAEDPEKILNQTVVDLTAEIKEAKKEVVSCLASEKMMAKKRDTLLEDASKWEEKALLALKAEDEELAREALRRKQRASQEAEEVEAARRNQEAYVEELKSSLAKLEDKVEDLKLRKSTIAAQVRQARKAPESAGTGAGRFGSKHFDDLERFTSKIDQMEAEVEAHSVIDDPGKADLDRRFRDLEKTSAVDDELAALKEKLK
ncbi:MAG: PspA/IM30 family protein [Deltaproteobacteria bacterium]|nr:PspA/IM30 family protein [Deltaproteobacteria bacterium]